MSGFLFILVIIGMIATVGVLFLGLFSVARGGEFNQKYGNKLMRLRVLFQFATIVIFILWLLSRAA